MERTLEKGVLAFMTAIFIAAAKRHSAIQERKEMKREQIKEDEYIEYEEVK